MSTKRKYTAVGTGGRIPMFIDPNADTYRDVANRSMATGRPVEIPELFQLAPQAVRLSQLI